MAQNPNWLDASDWKWVQETVPIACCDVVPVQTAEGERRIERIGLIYRDTPHQGKRWCMLGGRMWRNETMVEAIARQVRDTLGPGARFNVEPDRQPDFVAQYFTTPRPGHFLDPRQHAFTAVFVVPITGEISAGGEAELFQWFDAGMLPPAKQFGFEQDKIINASLKRWTIDR